MAIIIPAKKPPNASAFDVTVPYPPLSICGASFISSHKLMYTITPAENPKPTDSAFKLLRFTKNVINPPKSVDIPANRLILTVIYMLS